MKGSMKVTLKMKHINQLLKVKGLSQDGSVQAFHTANVMRRIIKYMPYHSGATIKKTIVDTDINKSYIMTDVPYGKYLYYGKAMEGKAPKRVTDRPLEYTKTKNPRAGPFWDRALCAAEMPAMQADLQRYINRKRGRG